MECRPLRARHGLLGWGRVQEWGKLIALGMAGHLNCRRKRSFQGQIISVVLLSGWPLVSQMLLNLIPRPSGFLGGSYLSIGPDESQNHFVKFPKNTLLEWHCFYGASGRIAVCPMRTWCHPLLALSLFREPPLKRWCHTCQVYYMGDLIQHRRTQDHKV